MTIYCKISNDMDVFANNLKSYLHFNVEHVFLPIWKIMFWVGCQRVIMLDEIYFLSFIRNNFVELVA